MPVLGLDCYPRVRGYIRCDQLFLIHKEDRDWGDYVTHLIGEDMRKVENGLRAALQL